MLNDHFGIQTRGGCSCAGTYGHYLLNVSEEYSSKITSQINNGDCSIKPGWIRLSIHPTDSNENIAYILEGISELAKKHNKWKHDYDLDLIKSTIKHKESQSNFKMEQNVNQCFTEKFI